MMEFFEHYAQVQHLQATALAKHLREAFHQTDCTKDRIKDLGGQKGLQQRVVLAYKTAGLPLLGAPGWPWELAKGQGIVQFQGGNPTPTVALPQVRADLKNMTAKDQSARYAKARLRALQLDKDATDMTDPDTGNAIVDPMYITGPGFVHPYYWAEPALAEGQEYRVVIVLGAQGRESTHFAHPQLNGVAYIIEREKEVAIPREIYDVLMNAVSMVDIPKTNASGAPLPMDWEEELKWKKQRSEHVFVVGDVVTDKKGNIIRWLRRLDGQPIPQPRRYEPEMQQAQAM